MKHLSGAFQKKAEKIELLLLDVDGVLTDGGIIIDDRGVEAKRFDVRDGQGIALLIHAGIKVGFITGRSSMIVRRRAKELGVTMVYQGVRDKGAIYERIKKRTGLQDMQIGYVGDDIPDLPILRKVGLAILVKGGWPELKTVVDYVTKHQGGKGAVREISELLLKAKRKWNNVAAGNF